MPNWCYSHITIYSQNKDAVTDLHNKIDNWLNSPTLMPDAWAEESTWLGNMLLHADFPAEDVINPKKIRCRGYIESAPDDIYELNGYTCFSFTTETAWAAMIEMWYKLLEKLYPNEDIRIAYSANEPNMAEYYKWDPENLFYPNEDYYLDFSIDGIKDIDSKTNLKSLASYNDVYSSDYLSKNIAVKFMQEILQTNETDENKLLNMIEDYNNNELETLSENAYIYFHKYDICRTENG